jgi:hypothetical protein
MTSRGLRSCGLVLAAAGLALALADCGDLSLFAALKGDSPGELRFSPATALVPENTDFTFSVLGGFSPYEVAVGAALSSRDGTNWVFQGKEITGESELFTILATDLLGNTATAEVTVYAVSSPLALDVTEVTLQVGLSWTFTVTGGSGGYVWSVDDVVVDPQPAPDDAYTYLAGVPGNHTVVVSDSLGLSQAAQVIVVDAPPPNAPLTISPTSAAVAVNGTLGFTATGGTGQYTFAVLAGGAGGTIADAKANPVTYTAPAAPGTDTVRVTDDGSGATLDATVSVIAVPALQLSPQSPTVSAIGDTIQFEASGGTGQGTFTFSSGKPDQGSIDPLTGYYVQLGTKNVVVTVTDANGATANTVVKFK